MTTTTLPDNLMLRPATEDDAPAIVEGMIAEELAETGKSDTTVDEISELWTDEGTDLENDTRVLVTAEGQVIGYVGISAHDGFMLDPHMHVRPQYHGRGLEHSLLQFAEQRARERVIADSSLARTIWTYSFSPTRTALLQQGGCTVGSSDLRMQLILHDAPPNPKPLDGITIRPYIPGQDERAIHYVVQEAFRDIGSHPYRPFEEWEEGVLKRSSFDPTQLFVAVAGDEIVGVVICRSYPDVHQGFINQVAVLRSWRRHGIALQLLYTAFGAYYRRGMNDIILDVDAENTHQAFHAFQHDDTDRASFALASGAQGGGTVRCICCRGFFWHSMTF
jgi:mycothiol synthase